MWGFFLVTMFLHCREGSEPVLPETGEDYFPLEVGREWVYQVDSVIYDPMSGGIVIDTHSVYVLEKMTGSFMDDTGHEQFIIERYVRSSDTTSWDITDVWTAVVYDKQALRSEENLTHIKLKFPLKKDKIWVSTAYFDPFVLVRIAGEPIEMFKSWSSRVMSIGEPETIGDQYFDEVTTVSHADNENLIELRYAMEKYARHVGLVYRELKILDTQCIVPCEGMDWEVKAEKGFILRQELIDYK